MLVSRLVLSSVSSTEEVWGDFIAPFFMQDIIAYQMNFLGQLCTSTDIAIVASAVVLISVLGLLLEVVKR